MRFLKMITFRIKTGYLIGMKELRDCFALSDRIGRALGSQSVRRVEG